MALRSLLLACIVGLNFWTIGTFASEKPRTLVVLGDSLTEGLGVAKEKAYPALLEKLLNEKCHCWKVVNAGISGSTSASAPSRARWILKSQPDAVLVALGANDGLRGRPAGDLKKDLRSAIEVLEAGKTKVILAGMMMPPNYGAKYRKEFQDTFSSLAKEKQIPFIPFLLEGVAGDSKLNQPDGIHPNESGHEKVAAHLIPSLRKFLP